MNRAEAMMIRNGLPGLMLLAVMVLTFVSASGGPGNGLKRTIRVDAWPGATSQRDEWKCTVDASKWNSRKAGGDGWGNHELEYYTSRPQNSYLQDGNLPH